MAIRIRKIDGHLIALCAAKSKKQKGDIYLDDNIHHALATKFAIDNERPRWADPRIAKLMKKEESKEALSSRIKPERMDYLEIGPSFRKPKNKEA